MPIHIPNVTEPASRVRMLSLTPELLVGFFQSLAEPRTFTCNGLPADAAFVSCAWDPVYGLIRLLVASETFAPRQAGSAVEEIVIDFTEHYERVAVHR